MKRSWIARFVLSEQIFSCLGSAIGFVVRPVFSYRASPAWLAQAVSMPTYTYTCRWPSIQERFADWLSKHEDIYAEFRVIAASLLDAGVRRYGAKAIVEIVRFHRVMSDKGPVAVDNDFVSRMARKLVAEDARFREFFVMRKLRS